MIQIPAEAIYILIAIIIAAIIIAGIIYHYKKIARVTEETEAEVRSRLNRMKIEGNLLRVDGAELKLEKYEQVQEYDMMNVAIFGKEDVFLVWRKEKVEQLKRDLVRRLPFNVHDETIQGTNIRRLRVTTYLGAEK